ncbi:MAG: Gfo/Idh/MocA family oxidoreductase [Armatimonadetes bacterium]|nr:Gfo/Idh/MocA family oxidoreductase [Armatimonadota bacterium]
MSLRIGIVGTGKVARDSYLPYLTQVADVDLVYYSRTRDRAVDCAETFGGAVADSLAQLAATQPDAILVLTHETQRYEATLAVLEHRPKRLFFEKPLVAMNGQANVTEDDFYKARELLLRAEAIGCQTAMVFNYRFFEQTQRAKALVAQRGWGRLQQASLLVNYACWSHCIDLLTLFGGSTASITALAGGTEYQGAVDVAAAFLLAGGATGTIIGTSATRFASPLYEMLFCFEGGSLRFSDLDGPLDVYDNATRYRETHELIGNHSRWEQYSASFGKSLAAYLQSIRDGVAPPVPGVAGLQELQFEAALRRSAAERRPVDVTTEFPLKS